MTAVFDWRLVIPTFGLTVFGLLTLLSIAAPLFLIQIKFVLIGLVFFVLFSLIDYRIYRHGQWFFYFSSLIILFLTTLFGTSIRGAERWLTVGQVTIQTSEVVKPLIILFIASYLSFTKDSDEVTVFKSGILVIPIVFLIFLQPDLGSSLVIGLIFLAMILAFGLSWRYFISGLIFLGVFLPVFWKVLKEYQRERLLTFFDPLKDPLGAGYNVLQSLIAVGSGQLFGRGLGQGTQSHLRFLPERQSDFVFASFAEEWGFLGATLLLILLFFLILRLLNITRLAPDRFGSLIGVGVFSMIFFQTVINLGMNLGILPITGITLPLISSGGSSFVSVMISLGIVQNIARQLPQKEIYSSL